MPPSCSQHGRRRALLTTTCGLAARRFRRAALCICSQAQAWLIPWRLQSACLLRAILLAACALDLDTCLGPGALMGQAWHNDVHSVGQRGSQNPPVRHRQHLACQAMADSVAGCSCRGSCAASGMCCAPEWSCRDQQLGTNSTRDGSNKVERRGLASAKAWHSGSSVLACSFNNIHRSHWPTAVDICTACI